MYNTKKLQAHEDDAYSCERPKKSRSDWKELATQYHRLRMTRANTSGKLSGLYDEENYLVMGLGAAVGKVMTQAKRMFGGDTDGAPADFADALASVRIYVEQLAAGSNIDLDGQCLMHMQKVCARVDQKPKQ